MHRLAVIALTLLVVFASVLPTVLARETNGDRFKRGYPPLPPSRREVAKRQKPSAVPPKTTVVEVRDSSGVHHLGFLGKTLPLGVTTQGSSSAVQVSFSAASHTLQSTSPAFNPPFLGDDPTKNVLTNVPNGAGATIWSLNAGTSELTVNVPQPGLFLWDTHQNVLDIVTDPTQKPQSVRLYLVSA
ncbi:hypothetical protein DFH94DRAFT_772241 [Russula ochroleuca]|uniref:Uncharacterized protein n=1 Tax=Russula ochroleuca TaxID=152965 RepID=A0A9P5JXL0_9AGAM|nr:hypothetical protein DFH94DRAFT_772241 [Russula ochroleuca]